MPATYDDANLVVQLLMWSTQLGVDEAVTTVMRLGFDPDAARVEDPPVRSILYLGETIGTFVKQGVLDGGLVKDLWWIEGLWSKVGPAALRSRETLGEPRLYENFEALAGS
ncbi:MAG TPA: hypothetical protein VLZ77_04755 [Acidimicrobiales bacterium]|nr:hypothetical protein [Acidimicrobiales bacterium]